MKKMDIGSRINQLEEKIKKSNKLKCLFGPTYLAGVYLFYKSVPLYMGNQSLENYLYIVGSGVLQLGSIMGFSMFEGDIKRYKEDLNGLLKKEVGKVGDINELVGD